MKFGFGKYKGTNIEDNVDYHYLCMVLQHRWKSVTIEEIKAINKRTTELIHRLDKNNKVVDMFVTKNSSLHKNDQSWDDVISGFWLQNNFTTKEEELLNDLIKYLNTEYPDIFSK